MPRKLGQHFLNNNSIIDQIIESALRSPSGEPEVITTESLILAQNERWRRGLGMQVERESTLRGVSKVANG